MRTIQIHIVRGSSENLTTLEGEARETWRRAVGIIRNAHVRTGLAATWYTTANRNCFGSYLARAVRADRTVRS